MKNIFLLALVLLGLTLNAQNFNFGPKLGANVIYLQDNQFKSKDYGFRANFGANAEYSFNDYFSISADVLFSQKRKLYESYENVSLIKSLSNSFFVFGINDSSLLGITQFLNDTVYSTTKGSVKLNYIEIPLVAKINYKGISLGFGPYFSYLNKAQSTEVLTQESPLLDIAFNALDSIPFIGPFIKTTISSQFPGYEKPVVTESTNKSKYRTLDIGFVVDANYKFNSNVYFGMRYTRGLTDYRSTQSGSKQVNSVWMFNVGYSFGKKLSSKAKGIYDLNIKTTE
ncbi:MAG: outer membrane beta-barrel protein [Chitinophagaceae bacterium]|nr:outer membrane beta-barrel protein [Chitinophagaceae bacterium]